MESWHGHSVWLKATAMSRTNLTTQAKVQNIDKRSMRSNELKGVRIKVQHARERLT